MLVLTLKENKTPLLAHVSSTWHPISLIFFLAKLLENSVSISSSPSTLLLAQSGFYPHTSACLKCLRGALLSPRVTWDAFELLSHALPCPQQAKLSSRDWPPWGGVLESTPATVHCKTKTPNVNFYVCLPLSPNLVLECCS